MRGELRRIPLTGGAPEALAVTPWSSSWGDVGPDGRLIVRVSATSAEIVDPQTRQRVPLAGVLGEPTWSYDGRRIALEAFESVEADISMIENVP